MSACCDGPFRVRKIVPTVPAVVRTMTPAMPAVVRVETPGPMGPASTVPGPPGAGVGFGQITYTDRAIGIEDSFAPNVRQRLMFNPTSLTTSDKLLPPFKGHTFFVNNRLIARAMDDLYNIRVNLLVTSDQAGGQLKLDIDSGSTLGPLQADDASLFFGAGVQERVTFSFSIQVLTTFLTNGAALFLLSNRPVTVISETLLLMPASVQPSA